MSDLDKAKQIFYKYLGSHESIDRELGDYYKKLNVPTEVEAEWRQDILNNLKKKVDTENGYSKMNAIENYIHLISADAAVGFLCDILQKSVLDTLSVILILESLKRYKLHYKTYGLTFENSVFIKQIIDRYKAALMKSDIYIDDSYKKLSFMKNYDFSNENILKRIEAL